FLIGLMAGLYPAWIIARFNPVKTLKAGSTLAGDQGSYWLRQTLVVLQFTISASLLIAVTLISQQVNYLRSKSLGFEKDNIINVGIKEARKAYVFAGELSSLPQVKGVAFGTSAPSSTNDHWGTHMSTTNGDDPNRKHTTLILADDNYCKMYGLKLLAGRFLEASDTTYVSRTVPDDKQICMAVVNEKLVRELGFKSNEDAIEKPFWFGMNNGKVQIVGVVADFNTGSLHEHINPTTIISFPIYSQAGIKVEAGSNIPETIAAIEKAWKKVYPEGAFEFKFLDAQIDAFYKAEERLYQLFKIFAGLAMLISCLGLWGLSTLSAQQRTKEIGIRKVLGASVDRIVVMLSKDFLIMVLVALAIASPLAYYLINNWLQSFAFHINIAWQVFAIAGIVSLVIALLTVSFQAIKAALANPVESLRNE
ncbi:MAG TPA: FtsX-like permease family protein, partial [Chryseolinea sp.]